MITFRQNTPTDCKRFDNCSSPICPLHEGSMVGGTWFPDEEICQIQAFCHESWIRNQKKIANKSHKNEYYFTHRMLQQNCIIGRGIEGLDPDKDLSTVERDENRWLKDHPEKPKLTDAKREELQKRIKNARLRLRPSEKM